jgi:hypothetical protein
METTTSPKGGDLISVAGLWAESGDTTTALRVVDLIQDQDQKELARQSVVKGQLNTGDIAGALRSVEQIKGVKNRSESQTGIVRAQITAGDMKGAHRRATLVDVQKSVNLMQEPDAKCKAQVDIAAAQRDTGDQPGAQKNLIIARETAELIQDPMTRVDRLIDVANVQRTTDDIAGAQKSLADAGPAQPLPDVLKNDPNGSPSQQYYVDLAQYNISEAQAKKGDRRVSTTLRHMLTEFSEFFHVSWTGLLIHASVGTAGGLGALRTKRSG